MTSSKAVIVVAGLVGPLVAVLRRLFSITAVAPNSDVTPPIIVSLAGNFVGLDRCVAHTSVVRGPSCDLVLVVESRVLVVESLVWVVESRVLVGECLVLVWVVRTVSLVLVVSAVIITTK